MAGSFVQLKSGSWRARVDVDGFTLSGTFPTKRRVEKWVRPYFENRPTGLR